MSKQLKPGLILRRKYKTAEEHSAKFLGSGDIEVLSTPSMILFMEETCRILCDEKLPKELTTVGVRVDVKHLKAAPIGVDIDVICKLREVEGKKLIFEVEAYWGDLKIGEGIHERFIVNRERFLSKLRDLLRLKTQLTS